MKKVLFVCRNNACLSKMAEGFAARFGKEVMEALSAGVEPAADCDPMATAVLRERGMDVREERPRGLDDVDAEKVDLCVVFEGVEEGQLRGVSAVEIRDWSDIKSPDGGAYADYRRTREDIGSRVMALIRSFREGT